MAQKIEISGREEEKHSYVNLKLPYGIAKGLGLDTTGMTPSQVWDMLNGYGVKPKQAYQEFYDSLEETAKQEIKEQPEHTIMKVEGDEQQTNSADADESDSPFSEDAYSEERKNNAINTTDPKVYDTMARLPTYKVWSGLSQAEKDCVVDYTGSYSKYNEPLRGIEYGTSVYKGVGNVNMETIGVNYGGFSKGEVKGKIDALTSAIGKCSYDSDVMLRRGCNFSGMEHFFGIDMDTLKNASPEKIKAILEGKTVVDHGFTSCGSTKGKGFTGKDVMFSIYAPKGTKMMYVEPVSKFGHGSGKNWKGEGQATFGYEDETVIQRGTSYRITKVQRLKGGKLYVQMEVVAQQNFD